jgi:DNA-binding CsgD family transcriptional regulator
LTLPDATTIDEGAIMFIVQNDSGFILTLKSGGGNTLAFIDPDITAAFSLEDNATADGTWKRTFEYKISGVYPSLGDDVVFESASTTNVSVASLSSTQAIVCYTDTGNSSYGTACILNVSVSTITPGTPVVFESASTSNISVTKLSSTQAIVCYQDGGNSNFGTACILDVSGSTITPATPVVFNNNGTTTYNSVTTLSSTQAIVCYRDVGNSNFGTACILDVSGSTITPATPVVYESSNVLSTSVTTLSSTQALLCYQNGGNGSFGTARILDVSASTITPGTPVVFESAGTINISVTTLSSTQAIVCYTDIGNSSYGTACILDIAGSTITPGTPVVFESASTTNVSVASLSSTQAIVCYTDNGNSSFGTARILDVSGSTITPATPFVFNNGTTAHISVTALSNIQALICYQNGGNNNFGTSKPVLLGGI